MTENMPKTTKLIILAEIWDDPDDGRWYVTVESGYFLTDMGPEPDLSRSFATQEEAVAHAKSVSTEWKIKTGWWLKGEFKRI